MINGPLRFIKHILHKTAHNMFLHISQFLTFRLLKLQSSAGPCHPLAVNNSLFIAAKLIHLFQGFTAIKADCLHKLKWAAILLLCLLLFYCSGQIVPLRPDTGFLPSVQCQKTVPTESL